MTPIQRFWKGTPYNDVPPQLGIKITPPAIKPGVIYAQAVVIHLLTRTENMGNHNLYLDVIDGSGQQVRGAQLAGQNNNINLRAMIDKPVNEFGTNFVLHTQDTVSCWALSAPGYGPIASDVVSGFSTRFGGEIVGGQDYGHISFYVIFQLGATVTEPEPPDLPPISDRYTEGFEAAKRRAIEAVQRLAP